ncbi:MAG: protein phosphatase 2C domain-containing protein [Boseongicola sp.]|nr:protein phosphatase 2C domain-containing protein [Boseongicola sp.]MDD9979588.1 protein phosphatase 2C domain-containing protein [Boseongicola sp.]
MSKFTDIRFDVASVLNRGRRDYQEDAIATDFPMGADFGYAVLSDGMGGHAAGDVASKIVVTEVFSELKFQSSDIDSFKENVSNVLETAAVSANACMAAHTTSNPDTAGMGATLVAPVFVRDTLYWISIGDSPLYLFREGSLCQLNEDHSLGPHIDYMVRAGMMSEDVGRNHPDRNALTSVLIGETIERIDCPANPFNVADGDIFVVASDGLQFLSNRQIRKILRENRDQKSANIADLLLAELQSLNDPEQDNICFSVIKVELQADAEDRQNIFTPEFERHKTRPRQITTRPIKPKSSGEVVEVDARTDEITPPQPEKASKKELPPQPKPPEKDGAPIFLRRRWLASDGGSA